MPSPAAFPRVRFFDAAGAPLANGWLYTYAAGTTTPLVSYSDSTGTFNTNPIQLDAEGECLLFLAEGVAYDFALKDSAMVTQPSPGLNVFSVGSLQTNLSALQADLASTTPPKGAGQVGFNVGTTYAPGNTVGAVLSGVTAASKFRSTVLLAGNGAFNANPASGDSPHAFEIVNDNSSNQCFSMSAYGIAANGNNIHYNRYYGTLAAPTVVLNGAFFKSEGFRGWDGSGTLSQSAAAAQVMATQDWSVGNYGIKFHWEVTANNQLTRRPVMDLAVDSASGCLLSIGDGTSLLARILNNGTASGTQIHGSSDQAGAQTVWFGSTHATQPFENLSRANRTTWQTIGAVEQMRLIAAGLSVGTGADAVYRLHVRASGANVFAVEASNTNAILYNTNGNGTYTSGENAAATALNVRKDSVTGRSINAAGTISASGADYAEYMRKAPGCGVVAKGQIVGLTAVGEITDKWADAITFMVKSTSPSYVGGDAWGAGLEGDALEIARASVDRIAFAGQVPVNVTGAQSGDYIVPSQDVGGIKGIAVTNPDFDQYRIAVGRVIATELDGRARVIVKAA